MKKVIVVAIFIVLLISIATFSIKNIIEYQDRTYAVNYFRFMPFEAVLESRKWNKEALDCTYAIVSLNDAAPTNPPSQWIDSSLWHQTPMRFNQERRAGLGKCRNLICQCESDWTPATYQRLSRALSEPGSFYYLGGRQPPHDTLYQAVISVYSPAEKIAARVRFGD